MAEWNLVTGDKRKFMQLPVNRICVKMEPEELYDMVHTENFVLVDTKKKGSCGFMMEQIKGHEAIN
jgi:protein SCO1/2